MPWGTLNVLVRNNRYRVRWMSLFNLLIVSDKKILNIKVSDWNPESLYRLGSRDGKLQLTSKFEWYSSLKIVSSIIDSL